MNELANLLLTIIEGALVVLVFLAIILLTLMAITLIRDFWRVLRGN